MRLLADENVPRNAVDALRAAGHDVAWVKADAPGSPDPKVYERGVSEHRVVLTFDKGFGQLVFTTGYPVPPGVILMRLPMGSPDVVARTVVAILAARSDWEGHFTVIEEGRIRMTPLPRRS